MTKSLALSEIRIDGGTQPRAAISETTYRDYAAYIEAGKLLPPPDVFFDGAAYWLADGYHRYFAAKCLERTCITCEIHTGTRRDAVLFSVGANHGHGLQRTNADKRKAATTLLEDAEWSQWSNVEIAKRCGVSEHLIRDQRESLRPSRSEEIRPRSYTTKHGTEATMKTANIGKGKLAMPDRSKEAIAKRRESIRTMAAEGYSTRQIASALELSEQGCREIIKKESIDVPADRAVGRSLKHDANRIVERMVMDAENLTADTNLIDYATLNREQLGDWIDSLAASKKSLDTFIRRLVKEQQKHGEAA